MNSIMKIVLDAQKIILKASEIGKHLEYNTIQLGLENN